MQRSLSSFALGGALGLLAMPAAHAIGFGATVTSTTIGQRLDFSAQLANDDDASLRRECVTAEVRAGDDRLAPEQVRATIEDDARTGERRVRVTTRAAIVEPIVTIDVTVGCTSQIARRFVAFIDPPALRLAEAGGAFVPQRVESQVAPLVDMVNKRDRVRTAPARRVAAAGQDVAPRATTAGRLESSHRVAAAEASSSTQAHEPRRSRGLGDAALPATSSGPRLRLEAALPPVAAASARDSRPSNAVQDARLAELARLAAASASAPASPGDAASAALAVERARVQGLETALAQLRNESRAQQKTFAQLQARLREAEGQRYRNGLVFLLAIGMAFFALLAWVFWMLRPRRVRDARWFEAQARRQHAAGVSSSAAAPKPSPVRVSELDTDADANIPRISQPSAAWSDNSQAMLPVTAPASIGGLEVTTVLAPQSHYARVAREEASANAALRGSGTAVASIDELIDLEQQAEFFAVLGQDDAAAALLAAHLREHRDGSPLPLLHLLDLHRRRGHRGAFERVRVEHGPRMEKVAPSWEDAHDDSNRSLEANAVVLRTLHALWATPAEAMRFLEALLLRKDDDGAFFDLDGYRDLLLLYAVARDLAGQPDDADASDIDVYLPLDDAPTEPLRRDAGGYAVDLDISGWADMPAEPLVIRRSAGRRGAV